MMECQNCKGVQPETKVLPIYEATGLGAPFKVFLHDAVKVQTCLQCNRKIGTFVPDMKGLIYSVVFSRASHPRKLSGKEVQFIRKAMAWKAKDVAKELDVSAEHFSRFENGDYPMPAGTEKLFRLLALLKTPDKSVLKEIKDVSSLLDMIHIEVSWDVSVPFEFHFVRRTVSRKTANEASNCNDNEKWRKQELKIAS